LSADKGKARISAQDWETLYRRYFPKLGGYFASRGLSPTEAEDLAHDVFQELGQAQVPQNRNAYIYAVARNVLAQHRRRKIREQVGLEEYRRRVTTAAGRLASRPSGAGQSEEALNTEAEQILKTITARLPPKDAELVTLRFLDGLSIRQVAQRTNRSEDGVRRRIDRLRAALRPLYRP
jgi:RNA polymerase sigma-70 factor, ECF subfamily